MKLDQGNCAKFQALSRQVENWFEWEMFGRKFLQLTKKFLFHKFQRLSIDFASQVFLLRRLHAKKAFQGFCHQANPKQCHRILSSR